MFDECAGNFSHKRLKAVFWLLAVIAFFAAIRWYYISHLDRGIQTDKQTEEAK